MPLVQDRAICLRKIDYSETSQILLVFGRDRGPVRVIAKGAHRKTKAGASKFGGGLDLLEVGQAVFSDRPEKDLSPLTEWALIEGHLDLRRCLRGMYLGYYGAELISHLVLEHDPHPRLFDRFEATLLDLSTPNLEQAFLAFQFHLLRETGYTPEFGQCTSCGRPLGTREQAWFAASRGGVVCRDCEHAFPERQSVDRRLLDMAQYLLRLTTTNGQSRLPLLTRRQTDPINRLLALHVEHTLGKRLRLPDYVL